MQESLQPTFYIDSDHPRIQSLAKKICKGVNDPVPQAILLYHYVRDHWRYDPYHISLAKESLKASHLLDLKGAHCIPKAVMLAALARVVKIPSRLGFCDVTNHLSTDRFRELVQTGIYAFHGFTELYLNGKWIKLTTAFNKSLCDKFNVDAMDFDGEHDCLFQEYDREGKAYMEYVADRGVFADMPYDEMIRVFREHYPVMFEKGNESGIGGDFESELP